jgi:hypothetical protein
VTGAQTFGAQAAGAQAAGAQAAGSQQPLPNRLAWALETQTTAKAATASAGNRIRRNMGGTPSLGKTVRDTHAN